MFFFLFLDGVVLCFWLGESSHFVTHVPVAICCYLLLLIAITLVYTRGVWFLAVCEGEGEGVRWGPITSRFSSDVCYVFWLERFGFLFFCFVM